MRVLFFGDSITQGFFDSAGGWVQRLHQQYAKKSAQNEDNPPTIFNLGISGDKSDSVIKRLANEVEVRIWHEQPIALVFAIGTNNAYEKNGQPYCTPEQFAADLHDIIKISRTYSSKIMFVGLAGCNETQTNPASWDNSISWSNTRLCEYDSIIKQACEEERVIFVPVYDVFQARQAQENLFTDGLHPNDAGHQLIAELVQAPLKTLISS